MTHDEITHERFHWGILCYGTTDDGQYEQRKYVGYTVREARQLFHTEMKVGTR
jgi:hypothetical protein